MKKAKSELERLTEKIADTILQWYFIRVKKEYHMKEIYSQIARSATSIGANLSEAKMAQSSADYIAKLCISRKETNETLFWLERLVQLQVFTDAEYQALKSWLESVLKMLSATITKVKKNNDRKK